jgi:hypothetical protein
MRMWKKLSTFWNPKFTTCSQVLIIWHWTEPENLFTSSHPVSLSFYYYDLPFHPSGLSSDFSDWDVWNTNFSCACYMFHLSYPPAFCYFFSLKSIYFSKYPVLKHPQFEVCSSLRMRQKRLNKDFENFNLMFFFCSFDRRQEDLIKEK